MENAETLEKIAQLGRNLSEATTYYEEAIRILEAAFTALTQLTLSSELPTYQRQQAEHYRGLAIRQLACLLSNLQSQDHLDGMKQAENTVYNAVTLMRSFASSAPNMGDKLNAKD